MMLPVAIPPCIFKQYDLIVKEFLWEGRKPRIGVSKVCSTKDKGGLGLPNLRLYHNSFESAKIAKHWIKDSKLGWGVIHNSMCSLYTPIDR